MILSPIFITKHSMYAINLAEILRHLKINANKNTLMGQA